MSNAFHPVEVVAPRARSWSFAATTYDGDQTTNLNKPINQDNFAVGNGKCPPGPPGVPGLPGIDGGYFPFLIRDLNRLFSSWSKW